MCRIPREQQQTHLWQHIYIYHAMTSLKTIRKQRTHRGALAAVQDESALPRVLALLQSTRPRNTEGVLQLLCEAAKHTNSFARVLLEVLSPLEADHPRAEIGTHLFSARARYDALEEIRSKGLWRALDDDWKLDASEDVEHLDRGERLFESLYSAHYSNHGDWTVEGFGAQARRGGCFEAYFEYLNCPDCCVPPRP